MKHKVNKGKLCKFGGCGRPARCLELCRAHYAQKFHGKKLTPVRPKRPNGMGLFSRPKKKTKLPPVKSDGTVQVFTRISKRAAKRLRKNGPLTRAAAIVLERHAAC